MFFDVPATGTWENLCGGLETIEIRLDTPALVILQVFQPDIAKEGFKKPVEATATACDPDRTCDRNLKARVQFRRLNLRGASGSYVIERGDGRRQAGSFNVRAKPLNICE